MGSKGERRLRRRAALGGMNSRPDAVKGPRSKQLTFRASGWPLRVKNFQSSGLRLLRRVSYLLKETPKAV
jgi:hypothetical protein